MLHTKKKKTISTKSYVFYLKYSKQGNAFQIRGKGKTTESADDAK